MTDEQIRLAAKVSAKNPRNQETGRYGFHKRWDRRCECGHQLAVHAGEPPHPCFNEDSGIHRAEGCESATGEPCDCHRFRPAKRRRQ